MINAICNKKIKSVRVKIICNKSSATANLSRRTRLRSASSLRYEHLRKRLKFGELCFAFAGPAAWNSRPSSVQELSNTESFKRYLKTVLFQQCYGPIYSVSLPYSHPYSVPCNGGRIAPKYLSWLGVEPPTESRKSNVLTTVLTTMNSALHPFWVSKPSTSFG